jgi:excisionase family DNA binding protein
MLNVRQAADQLGLKPWSVYQMISAGLIPVYRIGPKGRTLRIAEADLALYLSSRGGLPPRTPHWTGARPKADAEKGANHA